MMIRNHPDVRRYMLHIHGQRKILNDQFFMREEEDRIANHRNPDGSLICVALELEAIERATELDEIVDTITTEILGEDRE